MKAPQSTEKGSRLVDHGSLTALCRRGEGEAGVILSQNDERQVCYQKLTHGNQVTEKSEEAST